jgi:hypothetical protein
MKKPISPTVDDSKTIIEGINIVFFIFLINHKYI